MSTFMANANNIERKWYVVDAANKPLGRVATEVADLLRGKKKATYTPHFDSGDFVIVINAA
ncbi:MAG: uL13 family ribosomal protein, partial [Ruminococcus sp.]|nr:uL13 family ribosomal protein [Ruminococcus sp.]